MKQLNEILTAVGLLLAVLGVAALSLFVKPSETISAAPPDDVAETEIKLDAEEGLGSRFDSGAGIMFSWGNYYATADGRLVEIETGTNLLAPAAAVARRWGPSYQNGIVEAAAQDDGAVAEPTDFIDLAGHEDKRWGPSYYADGEMVATEVNRDGLDLTRKLDANTPSHVTWGPTYYADDAFVAPGANVNDFMKQVDQNALTGKTWGPAHHQ